MRIQRIHMWMLGAAVLAVSLPLRADVTIENLVATGHDGRIDLRWNPSSTEGLDGYNVYRSRYVAGDYTKLNTSLHTASVYSDFFGENVRPYFYRVRPVINNVEGPASVIVTATPYAMTDEQLLTSVQEAAFRYFWDFAHPVSGMARERFNAYDPLHAAERQTVTTGGTGFGLMNLIVGVERGFITRAQAAAHTLKVLDFLKNKAARYYGAWPHWMNGTTGATIPFEKDGLVIYGADIVETSFLIQGMLTARQYFDGPDPVEVEIRSRATQLYEEVQWDWYQRPLETNGTHLWWFWSDITGWAASFRFNGAEVLITYLLAIASPTHPIPSSCYYDGFGAGGDYRNGSRYYGYTQWVSDYETPMFWTHYSFLGFDPRNKHDNYCNYFDNSRNIALIDRAYCMENPKGFAGYSGWVWGLTSSYNPWGYDDHSPGAKDNGTIAPTAAISSMPYTPAESLATLRHFYYTYGSRLWGPFGFCDAFNLQEDWFSNGYLAIDQGTIAPMIENSRTGLCWNLFMSNPEIAPALEGIGWATEEDNGLNYEYYEGTWTMLPNFDALTPVATGKANNFDLGLRQRDDYFAFRFTGYLDIPADGGYTFYLNSDDGSKLYIDGTLVVSNVINDSTHGMQERYGYIYLLRGRHAVTVTYFENSGDSSLLVSYSGLNIPKREIPVNALFRCNRVGDFNRDCRVDLGDLETLAADWLNAYNYEDFAIMALDWQPE